MRIRDWSSDVCSSDLEWHEANAEAMPLPDASFDVVLCQLGLQFMPDRQAALREMRRVLVDGGRLAFNVPGPMPRIFAVMGEAIARHVGAQAAGFGGQVFSLHEIGMATGGGRVCPYVEVSVGAGSLKK